jgi:dimethylargininase
MQIALTRAVSRSIGDCEVTFVERSPIDIGRAEAQHDAYCRTLERHGLLVLRLPAEHELPDAVFVEDPVLVLDEIAIGLRAGAASRRAEVESMLPALQHFRTIERMQAPGTADGGDIVRIDRTLFIGRSARTCEAGIRQLADIVQPHGYRVIPVSMQGCLHLKSGCTFTGDRVLLNPDYVDPTPFAAWRPIPVPVTEPEAADVLRLATHVLMPDTFPLTAALLRREGHAVETIDVSELQKAEAGVTCLSVIFETDNLPAAARPLVYPGGIP